MTRKRGTTVEILDHAKLQALCTKHGLAPLVFGSNALLRQADTGLAVVLSSEGVCKRDAEAGWVHLDTEASDWQRLPLAEVEAARTGETADLADHIRTFGSRLDVNHLIWREWAAGE